MSRAAVAIFSTVLFGLLLGSSGSVATAGAPPFAQVAKGAGSSPAPVTQLDSLPVPAQAVVSASLASGDHAFAASRVGSEFRLVGGGVSALLDSDGVARLATSGGSFVMRLVAMGRPGRMRMFSSSAPVASGNQVHYRGARVAEWFKAGPLGVEQGFSLRVRPGGSGGVVVLRLGLGGSLVAETASAGVEFVSRSGEVLLRYGGLQVLDAAGRTLPASLVLRGRSLLVRVSDEGAHYPVTVDPLVQQGPKLVGNCTSSCSGPNGTGENGNGHFGFSVALSQDGNTALIGAPADDDGHGAAWVFVRSSMGAWGQEGKKLIAHCTNTLSSVPSVLCSGTNGTGEIGLGQFGYSVALSRDGNTALIGAPLNNAGRGAAWVFVRSPAIIVGPGSLGAWAQRGQKLVGDCTSSCSGPSGTGENGDGHFGSSVALSGDGHTALIGAKYDKIGRGAAWVFASSGVGAWAQQGPKLVGDCASSCTGANGTGETGNGIFGSSVALSQDGNTALIGALWDSPHVQEKVFGGDGAVWVFVRSAGAWAQQGRKLVGGCTGSCSGANGTGESGPGSFGVSVALSADGNTALIGAPADNAGYGAAWVFVRSAAAWRQQGKKLVANCTKYCSGTNFSGESGPGLLGWSVALSADGNTALIGAPADNAGYGAAWVFVRGVVYGEVKTWTPQGPKLAGRCISSCGGEPGLGQSVPAASPPGTGESGPGSFGSSVALSAGGDTALIGAPFDNDSVGGAFARDTVDDSYLTAVARELNQRDPGTQDSLWWLTFGSLPEKWVLQTPNCWGKLSCETPPPGGTTFLDRMKAMIKSARVSVDIADLAAPTPPLFPSGPFQQAIIDGLKEGHEAHPSQIPQVRILVGAYPPGIQLDDWLDPRSYVTGIENKLTFRVPIVAAGYASWLTSWNHEKVVDVDGREAIVGGMNYWPKDYLDSSHPVNDLSMEVDGDAARDIDRFTDLLWLYVCSHNNRVVHLYPGAKASAAGGSVKCVIQLPVSVDATTRPSDVPMLVVGKLGDGITLPWLEGKTSPPIPGFPLNGNKCGGAGVKSGVNNNREYEYRNPGEDALRALVATAQKSIFLSQQDLLGCTGAIEAKYDERLFRELALKIKDKIPIQIVLSAGNGSFYKNGYSLADDASTLTEVVAAVARVTNAEAKQMVCKDVFLATIRNGEGDKWKDGKPFANHAKLVEVDDTVFYIGSENLYPSGVQELGVIVQSPSAAATLRKEYIDPVMKWSATGALINPATHTCN
jgi:hypothetical protein